MEKPSEWMLKNGYRLPDEKNLGDCTCIIKFSELFELMEFYAMNHKPIKKMKKDEHKPKCLSLKRFIIFGVFWFGGICMLISWLIKNGY